MPVKLDQTQPACPAPQSTPLEQFQLLNVPVQDQVLVSRIKSMQHRWRNRPKDPIKKNFIPRFNRVDPHLPRPHHRSCHSSDTVSFQTGIVLYDHYPSCDYHHFASPTGCTHLHLGFRLFHQPSHRHQQNT